MEPLHTQSTPLNRVQIVTVGAFGKAVARCLASLCANVQELEWLPSQFPDSDQWPVADAHIIAAWRPVPALCKFFNDLCYSHARPFIPVIADSSALCVGPVIVPGKSSCWSCWQLRSLQHAKFRQERSAMLQFYENNPQAGPAGYLEPFAMIGAAKAAAAIQSDQHLREFAGYIWQIDLFTKEISLGYVIGVDGCRLCGLGRPTESRTYAELQSRLALLRDAAGSGKSK